MPDARKTLQELKREWVQCQACELGLRRMANDGEFVFGSGVRRGIMLVGEGPGWQEERDGEPFVGKSGTLLRTLLNKMCASQVYFTNCVTCRSCTPILDEHGLPKLRRSRFGGTPKPMFKDEPPLPTQIAACLPRLHEEIYIVDPVVIVACGAKAAETLIGRSISITQDRGKERTITIPGVLQRPSLTDKRRVWARRKDGTVTMPMEQNMVRYLLVPTVHPAYVLRKAGDLGPNNPFQLFVGDVRLAVKIYERYILENFGVEPSGASDISYEDLRQSEEEEEDGS